MMFMYRDAESLKEIAKYKRPRSWITLKAKATNSTVIENGVAVVGIGNISLKNRDIVSDLAQEILMWEGVSTSVVFALVDGESLHGSVRSACPSISAAKLSKTLGTDKGGIGWGHADAAGYRYAISGFSFGEEEDESMKNEIWELLNKRELSHVLKIIKA